MGGVAHYPKTNIVEDELSDDDESGFDRRFDGDDYEDYDAGPRVNTTVWALCAAQSSRLLCPAPNRCGGLTSRADYDVYERHAESTASAEAESHGTPRSCLRAMRQRLAAWRGLCEQRRGLESRKASFWQFSS